jgi:serine/threonine-protein phosphatase Stp1
MIGRSLLQRWKRPRLEEAWTSEEDFFDAAARSHVGKVRQINEDRFLVRSERGLWAVADGMGGHSAGSDAATAAIEELAELADGSGAISDAALRAALERANRRIHDRANGQKAVSGSTIVVAWADRDRLSVFWAGDSRAYRVRDGAVQGLTHDHSVVQELLDAGEITAAEAERHPFAHLVTRALGASDTLTPDQIVVDLAPGDRVLLCSDGVSRTLDLLAVARGNLAIEEFADDLLSAALRCDGSDNATLVAIHMNALPT